MVTQLGYMEHEREVPIRLSYLKKTCRCCCQTHPEKDAYMKQSDHESDSRGLSEYECFCSRCLQSYHTVLLIRN